MLKARWTWMFVLAALGVTALAALTAAPGRPARKVAILVGPSTYLHDFRVLQ